MKIFISILTSASILLFSGATYADNCEQGSYFYEKKQYRSARTVLDPLVKKGEACAEYYIGLMYKEGSGMKKSSRNRSKGMSLIESAEEKGYPAAIKFMSSYH